MSRRKKKKRSLDKKLKEALRKAFFENGGSLLYWCGRSSKHVDRKKELSKKACRKKYDQ